MLDSTEHPNLVIPARSHEQSDANLKRRRPDESVNANPNVVRVQAGIQMSFPSQEIFWPPAFAEVTDLNYLRALIQVSTRFHRIGRDFRMWSGGGP